MKKKPVVEVLPETYEPSQEELEEDLRVPTTPEGLARIIGRKVIFRTS